MPHGYPDYDRFQAHADKIYVDTLIINQGGNDVYGPFFVGDVPALTVYSTCSLGGVQLQLEYFDSEVMTSAMSKHFIDLRSTALTDIVLPNLGPWLRTTVDQGGVNASYRLLLASSSGQRTGLGDNPTNTVLISVIGTAVGAGATITLDATYVRPGPALINVDTSLATWLMVVNAIDFTGAATRLDTFTHLHIKAPRPTYLPAQRLQLKFTNTTGAAGQFTASALAVPMWPGA